MLNLPDNTVFNRRIPKQKFYQNLPVSSKIVKLFTDQIDSIHWTHKLAPDTINVDVGPTVSEIQILKIQLKSNVLDEHVATLIDREIPYHLVFLVCYQGYGQLWIAYKEAARNREAKFKVDRYYKSDWKPIDELNLTLEGLNLDQVYESILLQIAGDQVAKDEGEELKTALDRSQEVERVKKAMARLEKRMLRERQYNIQVELHGELRKLKKELSRLEERRA